jgi:hypothetical protein
MIRSEVTKDGPQAVIARQRSSFRTQPVKGSLLVRVDGSINQVQILDDFFLNDCKGGAVRFTWTDTQPPYGSATFRFVSAPVYTVIQATKWQIDLDLEMMP